MTTTLQDDEVFGEMFDSKKPRPKRKRSTDVFITLNINEKFENMSIEQKQKFKEFAIRLFDDRKILDYFKSKTSPDNPREDMDDISISWKPELGPKTQKLH